MERLTRERAETGMRRFFALLLIATSGWLLYQTVGQHFSGSGQSFWTELTRHWGKLAFLIPAVGGVLGLLGGLTVFFGGPGGATLALVGAVGVAGFAMTVNETFKLDHFWDNEMAVGVVMLMLAAMAASITRETAARKSSWDQQDGRSHVSGRRIY